MSGTAPRSNHILQTAQNLHRSGRLAEAAQLYGQVLRTDPNQFDALYALALVHAQQGHGEEALGLLDQALASNPASVEALYARGCLLHRLNRFEDAIGHYDKVLAIRPDLVEALNNRGGAYAALNRHEEALASFDRAAAVRPGMVQTLNNRAATLAALKRHGEALADYDQALAAEPRYAEAHCNRGVVLMEMGRIEDACASFTAALAVQPSFSNALAYRGVALSQLGRPNEALADFDAALRIDPARADILYNRGNALSHLRRFDDAAFSFDQALRLTPGNPDLLYSRANALSVLRRYEEAICDTEALLRIDPDHKYARGILVYAQMQCCDWRSLPETRAAISADVRAGKRTVSPFDNGAISQSAEEQLHCARIWIEDVAPRSRAPLWRGERYVHDRIRIAYLSADFRAHPVAMQMAGVFEKHDRARFETTALSFTPACSGPFRDRLERAFEHFIDVRDKSDIAIAQMMREREIDIAVDLMGFTRECRTGIFAHRAAPVQINYLGYAGTLGADYFDYIVADPIAVPEEHTRHYAEEVVWLPDTFMPNDSTRAYPARTPSRAELGLPETGFVFCAFNGNYKITPEMFDIWMRLLDSVKSSVLWLSQPSAVAERNLKREAKVRGVAPERLIFAPFAAETGDHLARMGAADLFLDTQPYGAHSGASDALWAGLPVLTCLGGTFAGRVAASLLNAVGLPELIAATPADYEATALRLAGDADAMAGLKTRLRQNRENFPLFDTDRFRRNLEAAYLSMWENAQASGGDARPRRSPLMMTPENSR